MARVMIGRSGLDPVILVLRLGLVGADVQDAIARGILVWTAAIYTFAEYSTSSKPKFLMD